jgi:hypothetical protein
MFADSTRKLIGGPSDLAAPAAHATAPVAALRTDRGGLAWPGLAWPGLAWLGLSWPGLAWPGLARPECSPIQGGHSKRRTVPRPGRSLLGLCTSMSEQDRATDQRGNDLGPTRLIASLMFADSRRALETADIFVGLADSGRPLLGTQFRRSEPGVARNLGLGCYIVLRGSDMEAWLSDLMPAVQVRAAVGAGVSSSLVFPVPGVGRAAVPGASRRTGGPRCGTRAGRGWNRVTRSM